jgi:NCS1 family nucleobase:cation symporter-1
MTTHAPDRAASLRRYVETRHIDVIPPAARHGEPWQQFFFWLGANLNIFNVVLGAIAVEIGLTFWWALIAMGAGILVGALLIALHATQGPRLGVTQTIQSRAQWGFYGAAWMFPAVWILNVGFIAALLVLQAQAMQGAVPQLPVPAWIVIFAVPALVIGIFGYRWIHLTMHATAAVVGISLVIMLAQGLGYGRLPASQATWDAPHAGVFAAGVALLVIDLLSFGPFVSDYTRYMPARTSGPRLFAAIYSGNVISTFACCALGAYLAALLPSLDPVTAVGQVCGKWALVVMALSLLNGTAINAYTGSFQLISFASMWHRFRPESAVARVIPYAVTLAAGTVVAVLGYRNFVNNLTNFLNVLLMVFIVWSAVNLADYFVVQRGRYDVAAFFDPAGGPYGKVRWSGVIAALAGLAAEWPFISQSDYTGPLVSALGGADISWIVGWLVAAAVYLGLELSTRRTSSLRPAAVPVP